MHALKPRHQPLAVHEAHLAPGVVFDVIAAVADGIVALETGAGVGCSSLKVAQPGEDVVALPLQVLPNVLHRGLPKTL